MTRDFDSAVPLLDVWELQSKTPDKRVYKHSERVARLVLEMDDDLVTAGKLQARRGGDWTDGVGFDSREEWSDGDFDYMDHKNARIFHFPHILDARPRNYPLRESESTDNDSADGVDDTGDTDTDNTESADISESTVQATLGDVAN